jgi:hypothetical protein
MSEKPKVTVSARVRTPQGAGKVIRISERLKSSVLVRLDTGNEIAFRPSECELIVSWPLAAKPAPYP